MSKLKVFHFSNKPPFPLRDGGCVAISSMLKSLLSSKDIDLFHFTLATHKHPFIDDAYPESWMKRMEMDHLKIQTRTDLFGAIYHIVRNTSYNVARFRDKKAIKKITKILDKKEFDVVFMESIYLLPYLHLFKKRGIKVIVRTHNVEHEIWESMSENATFKIKKWYFNKLAEQLKKYEIETLSKVNGIISITEEDALFFQQFEPAVLTTVIPTAVRTNFPTPDYSSSDFYFLGAMDWRPNIEGIDWVLNKVMPDGLKGTTFSIGGKNLNKNKFNHPSVNCVGEVKDAFLFIIEHGICIIPMKSGSGLKIKLLENMAMGKPIVTTSEGVRGVPVTHRKEVLICDDPQEFKEYMYELHLDQSLRKKLGGNAKKFIQQHYSESNITRKLIAFLNDI